MRKIFVAWLVLDALVAAAAVGCQSFTSGDVDAGAEGADGSMLPPADATVQDAPTSSGDSGGMPAEEPVATRSLS